MGTQMIKENKELSSNEKGATAIEYGLITAIVGVAIIGSLNIFGGSIDTTFDTISASVDSVQAP